MADDRIERFMLDTDDIVIIDEVPEAQDHGLATDEQVENAIRRVVDGEDAQTVADEVAVSVVAALLDAEED